MPQRSSRTVILTATPLAPEGAGKSDAVRAITIKPPLTAVTLTANPERTASMTTQVILTAQPNGGGVVEYLFFRKVGMLWMPVQGTQSRYSRSNTYTFIAPFPGVQDFRVWVREVGNRAQFQAADELRYIITSPLLAVTLSADPPSPRPTSLPLVTFTATPIGGAVPEYRFDLYTFNPITLEWEHPLFFPGNPPFRKNHQFIWLGLSNK